MNPRNYSQQQEQTVDLREYLRVMLKRRWTIITVFLIVVLTVAIHTFTATPIYKATTRLIIEKENPNVVSIEEVMAVDSSGTDYYQTQYKIIESRGVAREVMDRLHLRDSEEFSPTPKDDWYSNLKRTVVETVGSWKETVVSLLKTEAEKAGSNQGEKWNKHRDPDSELISRFIHRIEVSPIRNSRLVDLSFEAVDPVLATRIVNSLAKAYMDQNLEIRLRAVKDAVDWLNKRIDEERKKVEQSEQALLEYKEKHGIITDFSSDAEEVTAQKLAQLNQQVVAAESQRVEAETRYHQALALEGSPDMLDSIPEVLNNELIREIKKMEVDLYKRMSELSEKYGRNHPKIVALTSELETLEKRRDREIKRVITSLKNSYQVALAGEESLKTALEKQKEESLDLNQKAIRYGVLRREAESAKDTYELLVKRFKETSLTEDMHTGNIRVVDQAEVPGTPVKPKKKLNLLLAVIVGLVLGIGLAFFFEYLDNTIKIPEDVKHHLKIPYLGPTPLIEMNGKKGSENRSQELVTLYAPKSTTSESYRGIRTNIVFSSVEGPPQIILVSSAGPREGKTLTSANLAITMAQAGSKTLLLDCDLRRPRLHRMFGFDREVGVTNLMVGNRQLTDCIVHTDVSNLDLIPSGPLPPNPSEMLGSNRMAGLMKTLRGDYARIIVDSPPVTAVTDAVILSKQVDGVVVVIKAGDTVREVIQNSLGQLEAVGATVLGAVLNAVAIGKDKYYYYYYYQYYHYYYGDDGDKKTRRGKKKRKKRSKGSYYGEEHREDPDLLA
ncbi:MAG: GumC family protein [Desulfobacteraceae bacterium]